MVTVLLLACEGPTDPGCVAEGPHLLVATVSTTYDAGALATSSADGSCVADRIASAGHDPFVRALGDRVVVGDRTGGDEVRVYAPGAYDEPLAEFSIGRGVNDHDVARLGDRLVVVPYDEDALVVTSLEGRRLGTIDLAPYADADGIPEADRVVTSDGRLYAVLQLLDRAEEDAPTGPGVLVPIDPVTFEAGAPIEVGPDPRALPDPTDPAALALATGRFHELDGEALRWTAEGDTVLATEADLGFDVTHVLPVASGVVLVGIAPDSQDGTSYVACFPDGGEPTTTPFDGWLVDAVTDGERVWAASRTSWNGAGGGGLWTVDPETCALDALADGFLLDPYALAWVDPG